jgi:hypothetical protein
MTTNERKLLSENPKYNIGDIIEIKCDYEKIPGIKQLKAGKYVIKSFTDSLSSNIPYDKIYNIISTRKNSRDIRSISQSWLEETSILVDKTNKTKSNTPSLVDIPNGDDFFKEGEYTTDLPNGDDFLKINCLSKKKYER